MSSNDFSCKNTPKKRSLREDIPKAHERHVWWKAGSAAKGLLNYNSDGAKSWRGKKWPTRQARPWAFACLFHHGRDKLCNVFLRGFKRGAETWSSHDWQQQNQEQEGRHRFSHNFAQQSQPNQSLPAAEGKKSTLQKLPHQIQVKLPAQKNR